METHGEEKSSDIESGKLEWGGATKKSLREVLLGTSAAFLEAINSLSSELLAEKHDKPGDVFDARDADRSSVFSVKHEFCPAGVIPMW
jgi:hypothetical protein